MLELLETTAPPPSSRLSRVTRAAMATMMMKVTAPMLPPMIHRRFLGSSHQLLTVASGPESGASPAESEKLPRRPPLDDAAAGPKSSSSSRRERSTRDMASKDK